MTSRPAARAAAALTLALLAAVLGAGVVPTGTAASSTAQDAGGKLLLVLDSSGSMAERAGPTTKIAAAKRALRDVVRALPDGAQVGMSVYGSEVFEGPGACRDSRNVVPVGPLDRGALTAEISSYQPFGETPIGYALQQAAADLGSEGRRSIVLVSDGEATCPPDPCRVARQITAGGIELKVDVVGLRVGGAAERQLRCIAREGGGVYTAAEDASSLASGLTQVSVRAFRPFAVSGTPVSGTGTPAGAPEVDSGQYVDGVGADGTVRYYRVPKAPGDTVRVAATARRAVERELTDAISLRLETEDGDLCAATAAAGIDAARFTGILTDAVVYRPEEEQPDAPCRVAESLVLSLRRGIENSAFGSDTPLRAEIVVDKEPSVRDVESLPPPVEEPDPYARRVPAGSAPTPVVGGVSFSDAAELRPGTTHSDTVRDGELLVYKVHADWGQSIGFTARLQPSPQARDRVGLIGVGARVRLYSPDRLEMVNVTPGEPAGFALWSGDRVAPIVEYTVPVRYRNRESFSSGTAGASRAGFYYFTVEMAGADEPVQAETVIDVQVEGEVSGEPTYVDDAPSEEPSPTAEPSAEPTSAPPEAADTDDGGGGLLVPALVGLVLVLGAVVTVLALRGRRGARS
jgi:Ca-activated chloride channel family protein